jgi:hypothetical protein
VPPEERLRAREQRLPGVAREELAESGEEDAIGRTPAWTLSLALEDAELVAKGEDLSMEPEFGLTTGEEGNEEEADQGVEESERHGRGIMAIRSAQRPVVPRHAVVGRGRKLRATTLLDEPVQGPATELGRGIWSRT